MHTEKVTQLSNAAEAIGYESGNPDLLWETLQAAGSPVQVMGRSLPVQGIKSLAGVGDSIMHIVLKRQSRTLNLLVDMYEC